MCFVYCIHKNASRFICLKVYTSLQDIYNSGPDISTGSTNFNWSNCNRTYAPIFFQDLSIAPDPVIMRGDHFTFFLNATIDIMEVFCQNNVEVPSRIICCELKIILFSTRQDLLIWINLYHLEKSFEYVYSPMSLSLKIHCCDI